MDLKSGTLYWPRRTEAGLLSQSLRRNIECDVAVIGAGLSGALSAHMLAREGLNVVVLDKRPAGCGSTSASTALVLYEIDLTLTKLIRMRGRDAAVRSYLYCLKAIQSLEKLAKELPHSCDFQRRSSLYLASTPGEVAGLKREFQARRKVGLPVQYLAQAEISKLFSFSAPAALYSANAAEIDPYSFTNLLLKAAQARGANLFERTTSAAIRESRDRVVIRTTAGHCITARWAVVATGYETQAKEARRVVKLRSSYVLATQPIKSFQGWHERCLIWETARPYCYLRTTPDDRIIIGGGDEKICEPGRRDRLISSKCFLLRKRLNQMFPQIPIKPAFRWAGTFGETRDGLPYIGRIKPGSRVFHALCYGANGTNFAMMAAEILRDAILQRPNRNATLFSFHRD